jgi:hypothetical protein
MQLGEFLNTVAAKLALQNDPSLISLLSNAQVANVEIGDDFANKINVGLMSLDGAKSSTEVKKHFDALALKAIDDKLNPLAALYGAQTEFDAEKSTYKRVDIIASKFATLLEAAKSASGDVTKDAEVKRLNGELQKIQNQLTSVTAAKDGEIAKLNKAHEQAMLDSLVNFHLSAKPYANKTLDSKTNITIARTILAEELAKRGAIIINDNGQLKLKNANAIELDLLDEGNKPITFEGFSDKILAEKSLLEVSKPKTAAQPTRVPITTTPKTGEMDMSAYDAAMERSMREAGGEN